uniref:Uncharacterized protein n=1 Tax=Steinernema glaseri TaxID=37863 RepID=A0A1I7XZH8_9BILA
MKEERGRSLALHLTMKTTLSRTLRSHPRSTRDHLQTSASTKTDAERRFAKHAILIDDVPAQQGEEECNGLEAEGRRPIIVPGAVMPIESRKTSCDSTRKLEFFILKLFNSKLDSIAFLSQAVITVPGGSNVLEPTVFEPRAFTC